MSLGDGWHRMETTEGQHVDQGLAKEVNIMILFGKIPSLPSISIRFMIKFILNIRIGNDENKYVYARLLRGRINIMFSVKIIYNHF